MEGDARQIASTADDSANSRSFCVLWRFSSEVVGATGFEPATPCAQGRCATRLRYAPTLKILNFTANFRNSPVRVLPPTRLRAIETSAAPRASSATHLRVLLEDSGVVLPKQLREAGDPLVFDLLAACGRRTPCRGYTSAFHFPNAVESGVQHGGRTAPMPLAGS